ncbi:MAG: lysylphosphatidylglycerol synthase transmembrane domain-containing protein [bacterium]|nr:lysylphosphatidylglycerol synthase transmembrane domain-containing protein [bacterium]
MRKFLAFLGFFLLGIILFLSVIRALGWSEIWDVIIQFWGGKGLLLLVLTLGMILLGALRWREILRHQGFYLPLASLLKQYAGGFSLSFFFPMVVFGNEMFRSYSLQELHGVPLQRGIVSVVTERFLEMTAYLMVLAVGVLFLLFSYGPPIPSLLWWILLLIFLLGLALLFFYLKSHRRESILRMFFPKLKNSNGFLEMEQEVLRFFRVQRRAFWEGMFLSFAKAAASLLRTFVLAALLGKSIGFFAGVTVTGFTFLSLVVPIPGQLGSHEALQVLVFQALGLGSHEGAAFAFLVRAAEFAVALLGLIVFFRIGVTLLEKSFLHTIERAFSRLFS